MHLCASVYICLFIGMCTLIDACIRDDNREIKKEGMNTAHNYAWLTGLAEPKTIKAEAFFVCLASNF